jgi:signal transduction histidine kinase
MVNAARKVRGQVDELPPGHKVKVAYLDLIIQGLQRIQEIVKRVLTFSPRRMEPVRASVREIVQKSIALAEHRASRSGVRIVVEGDDLPIIAEQGEIQQVLLNLLINACDALQDRGGRVLVRIGRASDWVEIDVIDDGPGMTEAQREQAFDLFFSTKEVGQGTGLGLSVASHIVTQHGGTLTLDTAPGQGCVFHIRLPLVRQD